MSKNREGLTKVEKYMGDHKTNKLFISVDKGVQYISFQGFNIQMHFINCKALLSNDVTSPIYMSPIQSIKCHSSLTFWLYKYLMKCHQQLWLNETKSNPCLNRIEWQK
jgi:hypothetical protein